MNNNINNTKHRILRVTSSSFNERGEIYGGYNFQVFYVQDPDGRVRITSPNTVDSQELRKTHQILSNYINHEKQLDLLAKDAVEKEEDLKAVVPSPKDGNEHTFVTVEDTFFAGSGYPEYTAYFFVNFHNTSTGNFKTMYNTNVELKVVENMVSEFGRIISLQEQNEEQRHEKEHSHKADA